LLILKKFKFLSFKTFQFYTKYNIQILKLVKVFPFLSYSIELDILRIFSYIKMGKKHPDHPEHENRVKNNVKVKIELIITKLLKI